jgi:3-oxoacyl-[acyl-carrier protein] reductase
MNLLDRKVAVVTGAGRGIGAAAARLLAAHGALLIVGDLDGDAAEATAADITAAGGRAYALPGDVTDPAYADQLVRAAIDHGGLDVLVANAGYTWDGMSHTMSDEQWEAMLGVHLTAPFRLVRAAAPFIRAAARAEQAEQGRARPRKLVFVSSTSGLRGKLGQANYAAAKAGVIGLAKTLAKEWGVFNVQSNTVAFGFIETRLTAPKEQGQAINHGSRHIPLGIPGQSREATLATIPLGRSGTPEEAAGPILFLASPLADFVSGHVLEVTGGT